MDLCQILLLRDCPPRMKMDVSVPNVSDLLQGPEHPNPGMPYTARGFPRYCYLPDNEKGRKVRCHALITRPSSGCLVALCWWIGTAGLPLGAALALLTSCG